MQSETVSESTQKTFVPLYSLSGRPTKDNFLTVNQIGSYRSSEDLDRSPGETDFLVALNSEVFGQSIRRDIVHLCLTHYMDGQRQGSANTKTRYEVRGSRRKLYAQKGMGKARAGDAASPTRRGGGVAFGPKPRDFSTRLPRKVRFMGMRVIWSSKVREGRLMAVETLDWPGFKTCELAVLLGKMGWRDSRTLFITGRDEFSEGFRRSCGNLKGTDAKLAPDVNIHDALRYPRVVMDLPALEYYEERLRRGSTMPISDSRKKLPKSRREYCKRTAVEKADRIAEQLVELQHERRFGQSLPPIPRRLTAALE